MKFLKTFLFIIFLIFSSCDNNEKRINELERKNLELKKQISNSQTKETISKTYVFAQINLSSPSRQDDNSKEYYYWKNETILAPIEEFYTFDKETEYRYLDNIENGYRNTLIPNWPIKISNRKVHKFNKYIEASEARRKINNSTL